MNRFSTVSILNYNYLIMLKQSLGIDFTLKNFIRLSKDSIDKLNNISI